MASSSGRVLCLHGPIDLLSLHDLDSNRYPAILESCSGAAGIGRYDILFAFPGERLTLTSSWRLIGAEPGSKDQDFLRAFDRAWSRRKTDAAINSLPFHGGWFVFLAYELAQQIEPGLALDTDPALPVAMAIRFPAALISDRQSGALFGVAEPGAEDLLKVIRGDVDRIRAGRLADDATSAGLVNAEDVVEDDPERFLAAVLRAKELIRSGDIYQANISRQWRGRLPPGVVSQGIYRRLRRANPAPFAGLAVLDGTGIVSSSPERLVAVRDGRVETRPIAGTLPRNPLATPDNLARAWLMANPKERAEHVMLLDLERSDLGRICAPGTVSVEEFMAIESYAHVHHIVSTVAGQLRDDVTPGEVIRALFPGGTITGCPKVRCMDVIAELEGRPRGAYTGSMGYVNHDGSCDFNILIRTILTAGDFWWLSAGSGIVADSVPELELDESRAKAKGMLMSLTTPLPLV